MLGMLSIDIEDLIPDDEGCPSSICHECGRTVVGRLSFCLACYIVFFCLSLILGTKHVRSLLSPQVRDALFLWAQCSSLFVAALVDLDVTFTVFVAAAVTMQFGFEPYGAMFSNACKELRSKTILNPAQRTKHYLQVLLMIGTFIHHTAVIVFPLFCRCYLNKFGRDFLSTFLTVICFLGIIAAASTSNKVRAATDGVATVMYVVAMVMMSTRDPLPIVWTACASIGDLVIGFQLLLWDFLTRRDVNSDSADQEETDSTIGGHSLATMRHSRHSLGSFVLSMTIPEPTCSVSASGSIFPILEGGTIPRLEDVPIPKLVSAFPKGQSVQESIPEISDGEISV